MRIRFILGILACLLFVTQSAAAQEAKPASSADVAKLQEQVKTLQDQLAELKQQNNQQQQEITALSAQLTAVNQRVDTNHNDSKAIYELLHDWHGGLEAWKGLHFLRGLSRNPNNGQLQAYGPGLALPF